MRVFFGISLPSQARRRLEEYTTKIRARLPRMKWVEAQNLHVTLRFMGEVADEQIPSIASAAREASLTISAFDILLGRLGAFPDSRRARVLWWGLEEGARQCQALFSSLEAKLIVSGFPREPKRYHPHLTLARLRDPQSLPIESFSTPSDLKFAARSFKLYKSTLTLQGPIYEIIEEFNLA
jgi:2'-5' RNA ligase